MSTQHVTNFCKSPENCRDAYFSGEKLICRAYSKCKWQLKKPKTNTLQIPFDDSDITSGVMFTIRWSQMKALFESQLPRGDKVRGFIVTERGIDVAHSKLMTGLQCIRLQDKLSKA